MTTIDPAWLASVTGGASRSASNQALTTQITQLKSTIDDAVRSSKENSGMSMEKMLPMMMMMKMKNR
jgi:hypothetical protein